MAASPYSTKWPGEMRFFGKTPAFAGERRVDPKCTVFGECRPLPARSVASIDAASRLRAGTPRGNHLSSRYQLANHQFPENVRWWAFFWAATGGPVAAEDRGSETGYW